MVQSIVGYRPMQKKRTKKRHARIGPPLSLSLSLSLTVRLLLNFLVFVYLALCLFDVFRLISFGPSVSPTNTTPFCHFPPSTLPLHLSPSISLTRSLSMMKEEMARDATPPGTALSKKNPWTKDWIEITEPHSVYVFRNTEYTNKHPTVNNNNWATRQAAVIPWHRGKKNRGGRGTLPFFSLVLTQSPAGALNQPTATTSHFQTLRVFYVALSLSLTLCKSTRRWVDSIVGRPSPRKDE